MKCHTSIIISFSPQATYSVETSKEKKTELWSAAVSWTGAGKKYVDVVTKKGKLTIKNPKPTAIKCKIEHALQVCWLSFPLTKMRPTISFVLRATLRSRSLQ